MPKTLSEQTVEPIEQSLHLAPALAPPGPEPAARNAGEPGGVYAHFRNSLAARDSQEPPPEQFSDLLQRSEVTHPANYEQRIRVLGDLQQRFGNRYVQRVVAATAPAQIDAAVHPTVQRQAANASTADGAFPVPPLALNQGGGEPLDEGTRSFMALRFGRDFDDVRIHNDNGAQETAQRLNAKAFTTGRDIYFSRGAYQPTQDAGRRLLAHELTHTIQQVNGQDAIQSDGAISQPREPAEQEAEAAAACMVDRQPFSVSAPSVRATGIARQKDDGPATDSTPPAPAPGQRSDGQAMNQDDARKLLAARATLSRVPRMNDADKAMLEKAIPGVGVVSAIKERDDKRPQLEKKQNDLEVKTPEHGVPDDALQRELDRLKSDIAAETKEIDELNASILESLDKIGVPGGNQEERESNLATLVNETLPKRFVDRAKQIAKVELLENRRIALAEQDRYKDICTSEGDGGPQQRAGLRKASRDLSDRQHRIEATKQTLEEAQNQKPIAGVNEEIDRRIESLTTELNYEQGEYSGKRKTYGLQYPILMREDMNVHALADADDKQLEAFVGAQVQRVVEDIDESIENIDDETIKIWDLHDPQTGFDIVSLTKQDLGIEDQPLLSQVIDHHIADERSDEAALDMLLGAIAITATIVAILVAGPLGGAVVGGGFGAIQLGHDVQTYLAQSAINNVSLDPDLARMSQDEPGIFWIVLDIIGIVVDAAVARSAIKAMRTAARALVSGGSVAEFSEQARRLAPEAADKLIATAERKVAGRKLTGAVGKIASEATEATGAERVVARRFTAKGHEIEVTAEGIGRRCSPKPCPLLRNQFQKELSGSKDLEEKMVRAEQLAKTNPDAAADAMVKLEGDLIAERGHRLVGPVMFNKLQKLGLDGTAIDSILENGTDLGNVKGRLFDELFAAHARKMGTTAGGRRTLGGGQQISDDILRKAEFFPGSTIRDMEGRYLTDGIFGYLEGDKLHVINVFEAKAGRRASTQLRVIEERMSRMPPNDLVELRKYAQEVQAQLTQKAAKAGKPLTVTVEQVEQDLMRYRVQKQIGGQVRETIERLDVITDVATGGNIPTRIQVGDNVVDVVGASGKMRVTGVLPKDVPTAGIKKSLQAEKLNFDILSMDVKQADIDTLAKEIKASAETQHVPGK